MHYLISFLLLFFLTAHVHGAQICSRTAVVNFQEILVDTNSTQKGEGLRFFLEKDQKATDYLNRYQEGTSIKWQTTFLGTLGTILLLSGIFSSNDSNNRNTYLIAGVGTIGINIVISKTLEHTNEINLLRSIEEYNKRNLPKIYFNTPFSNRDRSGVGGASINFSKDF